VWRRRSVRRLDLRTSTGLHCLFQNLGVRGFVSSSMPMHQVSVLHYSPRSLSFFPSFHIHFVRVSLVIYEIGRPSLQGNIQGLIAVPPLAHYLNSLQC